MAKTNTKSPDEMSFLDHLEELRWHLIRSVLAVVILATVAFIFSRFIFDTIIFGPSRMDFPTYRFFCDIATSLGFTPTFVKMSSPSPYKAERWADSSLPISGPPFMWDSL